jgi:hypothetical protein
MSKLIFENFTNQLVHITFNIERQEALEVVMDDACSFLKPLSILKREIVHVIYPAIYSLHLYPELREHAVQEAMTPCRIKKLNQLSDTLEEVKKKVIEKLS